MKGLLPSDRFLKMSRTFEILEHFYVAAPTGWTTDGTVTAANSQGGILSCASAATDNDPAGVVLAAKPAVVAASSPLHFACKAQYAEANTDDANVFIGLTNQALTAAMQDDGAGPPADYSGIGFHKVDGGTNWIVEFANSTTHKTTTLDADGSLDGTAKTAGGASYQTFEIVVVPKTSTACDVHFIIDGVTVQRFLDQVYTSLAAMAPMGLIKAGSANAETLLLDYIAFAQDI